MCRIPITIIAFSCLALLGVATVGTATAAGPTIHVVQKGQTLYSIASSYGLSTWAVARANRVWNPDLLYVGQVLVIPSAGDSPTFIAYSHASNASRQTFGCSYFVQYGDTMSSIAARYGSDPWAIARANGLSDVNWIYVGQLLRIPNCK